MRKNKISQNNTEISILTLDDDEIMTLTVQAYFQALGYKVDVENNPLDAIQRVRENHYDILLLDFLMTPICGDEVVSRIREFNEDIYIILLTGHKSMAPPIKTIRELDIQGYYEKSDRFDQLELLIESCVKSIQQMKTIRKYQDGLKIILDCIPSIYALQPAENLLQPVLNQAAGLMNSSHAFISIHSSIEETSNQRALFAGIGRYDVGVNSAEEIFSLLKEESIWGDQQVVYLKGHGIALRMSSATGVVMGVLFGELETKPRKSEMQLIRIYAKQISTAIHNIMLYSLLNKKNDELNHAYDTLNESYLELISVMRSVVDAKDIYTRGHSDRVAHYCDLIAKAMGKDQAFRRRLKVASLFHDIGKIATPDGILLKDSTLTEEEYEKIKEHVVKGESIIKAISIFREIAPIVRAHHERCDGKGYPDGLINAEIPEEAKIICIADAFDAMTSDRRYRSCKDLDEAKEEIKRCMGTQFDTDISKVFLTLLESYDNISKELEWTYDTDAEFHTIL